MDLRDGRYISPSTPATQVFFDKATPTTGGVVFDPNTPAAADTLYVSSTNSSTWIYQDGSYITYTAPVVNNTEWYITGTTIDAGGNKTTSITRNGVVFLDTNQTGFGMTVYNNKNSGASNGLLITRGGSSSGGYGLQVLKGSTNQLRVNNDGSLLINDAYTLPSTDGTANYFLKTNGSGALSWGVAGLSYFTEAQNTTVPNATVPVDSLTAVTGTTDGDFAIIPKGNGAILARVPDNTGTGGNKRGQYALDLSRTAGASGAYIAAGNYDIILGGTRNSSSTGGAAFIANGDYNSVTGQYGTILNGNNNSVTGARGIVLNGWYSQANGANALAGAGLYNYANGANSVALCNGTTASGNGAMSIGIATTASGTNSFAGGWGSTSDAINGFAIGDYGYTLGVRNKFAIGGSGWGLGMTQAAITQLDARTTNTTPTVLLANTQNAGGITASTQFTLPNNSLMRVKGSIQGKQSGSTNVGVWDFDAVLVRGTTASTMTVVISNINVVTNVPVFGTPTITANTSLGCMTVTVTGLAATNIQWACRIDSTETLYA